VRRTIAARLAIALVAALVSAVVVGWSTGLLMSAPVGATDNGDGSRLYCGAGIEPDTPRSQSAWMGGVVLDYQGHEACHDPIPSSALLMLRAAVGGELGPDQTWSLTTLGWWYVAAIAAVTAVAAAAVTAQALWRVVLLVPAMAPLANTDFARFFISTYGEPAGLLGAYTMLCGVAVVVATRQTHRISRTVGLVLTASGGLFTVGAKVAYAPVFLVAFAVCAVTPVALTRRGGAWPSRIIGPLLAGGLIVAGTPVITAGVQWQDRNYSDANVHNLIYTAVLTEIPNAARILGLPPEAAQYAGVPIQTSALDKPGREQIADDPSGYRADAARLLLVNPEVLVRGLGLGLQATQGRDLLYLAETPWVPGAQFVNKPSTEEAKILSAGQQSASPTSLTYWLDGMPLPWLPTVLVIAGLAAGVLGLVFRRALSFGFAVVAGLSAAAAIGLIMVALADGYFELAKHVWLASYFIDVTALALAGAVLLVPPEVARVLLRRRREPKHALMTPAPVPPPSMRPTEPAVPGGVAHQAEEEKCPCLWCQPV
jgi:hypothetical protein